VEGVIPLDAPFKIRGTVVKGFGRGSKVRLTGQTARRGARIARALLWFLVLWTACETP